MLQTVEFVINFSPIETVAGGSVTLRHQVEAFDMLRVEIPSRTADMTVELVPPRSRLQFLGIFRLSGSPDDPFLSYSVNTDSTRFVLWQGTPHFMSGPLIAMLRPAPESLRFYNDSDVVVDIMILVGRDATPTTQNA